LPRVFPLFIYLGNFLIHTLGTKSNEHQGGGADTLKFNLHIIGRAKKRCEFNQKRCELKNFLYLFIPTNKNMNKDEKYESPN
jgi:hypothetical protein